MKRISTLLILILLPLCVFGADAEEILFKSLTNSIEQGSFFESDETLVFLSGLATIKETQFDPDIDYKPQTVFINYLKSADRDYRRLYVAIYSNVYDINKERPFLFLRGTQYYNEPLNGKTYSTGAKASLFEKVEDGSYKLKSNYRIVGFSDDIYDGRECFLIELENTKARSTTKFWIEKERCVRLKEDYFVKYPVLSQRTLYIDYTKMGDYYIEKSYSIWTPDYPGWIRYYKIMDPQFIHIDDEFFEPEILEKI